MSFRPGDIARILFALVSSVLGAWLMPLLPFVGLPAAALALGWLAFRYGYGASTSVALLAAIAAALLSGGLLGLAVTAPVLLAAGPGCAWALSRWSAVRATTLLAVITFAAMVGGLAIVAAADGQSLIELLRTTFDQAVVIAAKNATVSDPSRAAEIATLAPQVGRLMFLMWPTLLAAPLALAAALSVPLVSRMGEAAGRAVNRPPTLDKLDLSTHLVWPVIAGLGLVAAATFMRLTDTALWAAGANMLQLVRIPLFFQGLGDFAALYRKAKVGPLGRALGFTFLTLSEAVVPSVSLIGLADLFFNLRKLPRPGSAPRPGLESGGGSV